MIKQDVSSHGWRHWLPGLAVLLNYRRGWLFNDVAAGLALTAILVPVGMGYAEASGVPAIHGLYASILPLIVYALMGPSRIMVLGPDSTLAAVIAALILPLSGGSAERAVALAGMLALLSGTCSLVIGLLRLGLIADLLSKPIRIGFLNAIALTVIIGQLPKVLGFSISTDGLTARIGLLANGIAEGKMNPIALAFGAMCLVGIVLLKRIRPNWPGVLLAVGMATVVSAVFDLASASHLAVLGPLPQGLPALRIPLVAWADVLQLLPGAAMIAVLSFADTSVLSRSLAQRAGYRVSQDQEMVALGAANIAAGLFQGFSVSGSASRTPIAAAAGSKTQLTGLVGAAAITLLLVLAPDLLRSLPAAALGAVVIAACLSFVDFSGMWAMRRQRPVEFALAVVSFLGVALVGVIEGILLTLSLAVLVLVWNAWHPHFAVLARVDGQKGYHDIMRHPEGRTVPGLILFRWDAQLFFANAELFRDEVLRALANAASPVRRIVVAADAITDIDITAADTLIALHSDLSRQGVDLYFAGMKGPVKDRLKHYGTLDVIGHDIFEPTVGRAVNVYRTTFSVAWKDWDEE